MNPYTQPNIEGINKIELIDLSKVSEIIPQDAITGAPVAIVLLFGAVFEDIPFVAGTGEFSEEPQTDISGEPISQTLSFAVAKNRQEVDAWLDKYGHLDFLAKVTDINGNIRIIGKPGSGSRLSAPMTNPASGRNQYSFTISALSDERAPYMLSADDLSNIGNVFSDEFSNEFTDG
jgi:hypothetical protein